MNLWVFHPLQFFGNSLRIDVNSSLYVWTQVPLHTNIEPFLQSWPPQIQCHAVTWSSRGQSWLSSGWSLQPTREAWERQHPRADLSPLCPRASQCVILRSRVQASHGPPVGLSSLPKSQLDWGPNMVHSPRRLVHPCNLFVLSFLPGAQITAWPLSFPSYSVTCVSFF